MNLVNSNLDFFSHCLLPILCFLCTILIATHVSFFSTSLIIFFFFFFFNDTATTEIYTLSLHDALPIYPALSDQAKRKILGLNGARVYGIDVAATRCVLDDDALGRLKMAYRDDRDSGMRSEEHTSELQSLTNLVCRLLLEKKKTKKNAGA